MNIKAIILAAGEGKRLGKAKGNQPKCLVKLGGKSLLQHQLSALQHTGINRIVIVVGYRQQQVMEHAREFSLDFKFLTNSRYSETNTAYSLWLTKKEMDDSFLYLNADVLFHPDVLHRLIKAPHGNAMAIVKGNCGVEEVKVVCKNHIIQRIGKNLDKSACYGEFIGIAKFSKEVIPSFKEKLDEVIQNDRLENEYFEAAVDRMLIAGVEIEAVDVGDLPCIEIDFPEDLERARREIYPQIMQSMRVK